MDSVMPSIGGGIMNSIPDMTGPALPLDPPAVATPMPKL